MIEVVPYSRGQWTLVRGWRRTDPSGTACPGTGKEPDSRRPSRRGTAARSFGLRAEGARRAVSDSARMRENCGWRCHKTWSRSSVAAAGLCPRTSSFRRCSPLGCPGGMTNKVLVVWSEMDRMTTCVSCSGNEPTRRRQPLAGIHRGLVAQSGREQHPRDQAIGSEVLHQVGQHHIEVPRLWPPHPTEAPIAWTGIHQIESQRHAMRQGPGSATTALRTGSRLIRHVLRPLGET